MTRWWRRGFFLVGFLIAFAGGIANAGPALILGVVMVLVSLLPTRADPAPQPPSSSPLVEADGHTWTQQPGGSWLRWNATGRSWEDVGPPPPEILRNRPTTPVVQTSNTTSKVIGVVSAFLVAGVLWALLDPMAQIPGISQVVCSVKGGTWHDGSSVSIPAGCYPREP